VFSTTSPSVGCGVASASSVDDSESSGDVVAATFEPFFVEGTN
jgi:hypothetical protein